MLLSPRDCHLRHDCGGYIAASPMDEKPRSGYCPLDVGHDVTAEDDLEGQRFK
jgi:hypothetical protein